MRGFRRLLLAMLLAVWMSALSSTAHAATASGRTSVKIGHPETIAPGGITETEFSKSLQCKSLPTQQNFDGSVFDITGYSFLRVQAWAQGLGPQVNISYYNADCWQTGVKYAMVPPAVSAIPAGSAWAVVSFPWGHDITFEWRACTTYAECKP